MSESDEPFLKLNTTWRQNVWVNISVIQDKHVDCFVPIQDRCYVRRCKSQVHFEQCGCSVQSQLESAGILNAIFESSVLREINTYNLWQEVKQHCK